MNTFIDAVFDPATWPQQRRLNIMISQLEFQGMVSGYF